MFRSIVLGCVSLFVLAASAEAADFGPGGSKELPAPTPLWSGFYIGVNGGYGWVQNNSNFVLSNTFGNSVITNGVDQSGGFGGGQLGYNWQYGSFVFGFEADFQGAAIDGKFPDRAIDAFGDELNAKRDLDFFGTVRGRIGYAWGPALIYATAGVAFGEVNNRLFVHNGPFSADLQSDHDEGGFVVGGGLEYLIYPGWSVKIEYQYIDLGNSKLNAAVLPWGCETIFSNHIDNNFNTVRVGLNWHFQQPYQPLK